MIKFQLRTRLAKEQVMFGCLDTWLLWQLTGKSVFATDYSNASVTMLFDPFQVNIEPLCVIFGYKQIFSSIKSHVSVILIIVIS